MRAGQTDGKLVYHGQGYKMMDGYEALPADLKEWVANNAPEYQEPPSFDVGKNVTSWRYMDPGIIKKPIKIAPTTVFQSNPSSK